MTKAGEIKRVYQMLNTHDLKAALIEIKELSGTGILKNDGIVRKCFSEVIEITNESFNLHTAVTNILTEAAFRWLNEQQR